MGTAGTLQCTLTAPADGSYRVSCSYQNFSGTQAGTLTIDGTDHPISLASLADSTALSFISSAYTLTAGSHTIKFAVSNVNLDYILLNQVVVGIKSDKYSPNSYALEQNYPNPFNPSTKINFSLAKTTKVDLSIYNILGQKIVTLVNGVMNVGPHVVQFNASKLASGVYFYGIKTQEFETYKKMMLLK
jgi:hypothetical protein